ncbi:MAG: methyltransferase domain-containing protein [Saprospiraceae bacterium]|nr:methyltransferase domain-containing protein [Lewinella sp.]
MAGSRLDHHSPKYADGIGNFGLSYHLELIKDAERVSAITAALDECLNEDSVHCELGVGTGIFAIYAAKRCRKVYAVERDPAIFRIAQENIDRSGMGSKIELILADASTFIPPEKSDTLLVEMMSVWCINEPQIPVLNHAIKHILKQNGRAIPGRIVNTFELGYYHFDALGVNCKASIPEFSGITKPRIMTTSYVFNEFDFRQNNPERFEHTVPVTSLLSGTINCARLSSLVQLSEGVTFFSTDSLMPQTIIPLQNELEVRAGEPLHFSAAFDVRTNLDDSNFWLE